MRLYLSFIITISIAFSGCYTSTNKTIEDHSEQNSNSNKLPIPSKELLSKKSEGFDTDIRYLESHFIEIGLRQYEKDSLFGDSINWSQKFEGGISITYKRADSGLNYRITFPNYDKKEILKFMKWFYDSKDNKWNKDSTEYSPTEGDAGCYYQIKKDSLDQYVIDYYCGC